MRKSYGDIKYRKDALESIHLARGYQVGDDARDLDTEDAVWLALLLKKIDETMDIIRNNPRLTREKVTGLGATVVGWMESIDYRNKKGMEEKDGRQEKVNSSG